MTPQEITTILRRLDEHGAHLRRCEEKLGCIQDHVEKTNGRVSKLELWRARKEGASAALSWIPSGLVAIAVGITVGVVTNLIT